MFGYREAITGSEAAVMLRNALDLTAADSGAGADATIPVWALDALNAVEAGGISLSAGTLTRADTARVLYQCSQLKDPSIFTE